MASATLEKRAQEIRRNIIKASYETNACHIGSALSCVEILLEIYSKLKKEDYFVFSKASGVCALYAVLAEKGIIPKEKIAYYLKKYPLPNKKVPGVILSGGSCGHGLPVACGMALADRTRKVYVLMSDAELQEGTTWECLLFKKQHKLDNLIIYVDNNGFQACGRIKDILDLPWSFLEKNGFKIIKTTKGKGISFMENNNNWHYLNLDKTFYEEALHELSY